MLISIFFSLGKTLSFKARKESKNDQSIGEDVSTHKNKTWISCYSLKYIQYRITFLSQMNLLKYAFLTNILYKEVWSLFPKAVLKSCHLGIILRRAWKICFTAPKPYFIAYIKWLFNNNQTVFHGLKFSSWLPMLQESWTSMNILLLFSIICV